MDYKLLVIGKLPPPIGGVTIHVKRFLDLLSMNGLRYTFFDLRDFKFLDLVKRIIKAKLVHLHVSNVEFQFFLVVLSKILGKKSVVTIHGDLFRFKGLKKKLTSLTIRFCDVPILLNEKSYLYAKEINPKSFLMTAFLPPLIEEIPLDSKVCEQIDAFKTLHDKVFATNASAVNYDVNEQEIYGVLELIDFFKRNENRSIGLIISDPSGEYEKFLKAKNVALSTNIVMLSFPHSYFEIIKRVDATIRNTSTDGDSLSIRESLFLKKSTFATDVVQRPAGTVLYRRGDYSVFSIELCEPEKTDIISIDSLFKYFSGLYSELSGKF